jgi:hypothetical protein
MPLNADSPSKAKLLDLRKIWDQAPHNALTDLIRFGGQWLCVFREGADHVSPDGKIRILVSHDGLTWSSGALLEIPDLDARDPKLSITPSGQLMLNAGAAHRSAEAQKHQSFVWFSGNGLEWSVPQKIGDPDCWLWRVTWHQEMAYGVGYSTVEPLGVRLYCSPDGSRFECIVDRLFSDSFPNEGSIAFQKDDTALCLLRRDAGDATALLGSAKPPYTHWDWKNLGLRIGGPNLMVLPDGRCVAAIRRYGKTPWTSLNWLDPGEGTLREFMALPSGGDTSYAGLCLEQEVLWVSYYSSHEQRTSIYLAKIQLPANGSAE